MKLYNDDCLEVMKELPDNSIDLILTDLPYGTTQCKWDNIISYKPMWAELKRIRKNNTAIALFGTEPFSSHLRLSNLKEFKYDWYWEKTKPQNFMNAKKQPLRTIENISIFYKNQPIYNPQNISYGHLKVNNSTKQIKKNNPSAFQGGVKTKEYVQKVFNYPRHLIKFSSEFGFHNTQKPIALLEYLIKTYTKENETVLDFTMGSGSTGVACVNTNRNFIGIELDKEYYNIAKVRIDEKLYNNTS